ncbi:MAG: erythromycin esterase family protein [Saprospiraceae bacterium]|nr:erythromycin esterase family protein [Saprospiraceae bacterium]
MKGSIGVLSFLLIFWTGSLTGQNLTSDQLIYLNNTVNTICNDTILSKSNWQSLEAAIKNKRIVLLREPNHGSREIFKLRNDLIRFLHNNAGFNTVLFESGIGELVAIDIDRGNLTDAQMTHGFFGGWRTREFRDLMAYIKSSGISIAGFDVQRTGSSFKQLLNTLAGNKNIDTILYKTLEDRYGLQQRRLADRNIVYDSVYVTTRELVKDYQQLYELLVKSEKTDTTEAFVFSLRTIKNRINYLQYMLQFVKDGDWHSRWAARDLAMAENIKWLKEYIFKNEKLIVVAHNFHVARDNPNEQVMGAILAQAYSTLMYTVGVFAGTGEYADNTGNRIKMAPPDSTTLDIKHVIGSLPGFVGFLDVPKIKDETNDWLYRNITLNDSFIDLAGSNSMVLAKQFDGLLFIKMISMPEP